MVPRRVFEEDDRRRRRFVGLDDRELIADVDDPVEGILGEGLGGRTDTDTTEIVGDLTEEMGAAHDDLTAGFDTGVSRRTDMFGSDDIDRGGGLL